MKRLGILFLALAAPLPLLAVKPGPVCDSAPANVITAYNPCETEATADANTIEVCDWGSDGCSEESCTDNSNPAADVPGDTMCVTWDPPACGGVVKYAVEVTVHYFNVESTGCGDPAYTETFSFTTPTNSICISLDDVNFSDWQGPAVVKVKALTTYSNKDDAGNGRSHNASQNSPFSEPSSAYFFVCSTGG